MTLQQLQYFLAAIEHGTFSAAADALYMAQPSLSEQIRRLETELGVALFVRAGRRLVLTEAGRALRPEAERTLEAAARAAASVADVRELRAGTATFGTFGDAPTWLIGNVAAAFRRRHPDVRLRVVGLNSSEVADEVREGSVEAGLVVLPIDDAGLDVRPAMEDELVYVSAAPERVSGPIAIERLADAPLILYDARWGWEDPTRRALLARAQRAGMRLEPAIEVEEVGNALDLAARGLGDTVISASISLRRGALPSALRYVSFDPPLHETFAFITRRDAVLSPATRELIALAERQLADMEARRAAA
ncbi:LysR substrate-binding domain-containing protein [Conexibacter stalactiti]|uniref:LysR substrate-binding domain-containing protein n=1 Tax=Conexibacter stalactiti TaxID=1940611 RepID=A0ABU4HJV1_9ACTN|nr:LysR substrate-binding domain-containing protein [Conexibacter stalactiti]MDW5593593.1 LysR substrate-binding domain-containing protein [Conexibacter stalactiti]MEC5034234.1 LysR substrate-binding domain-containing protein [Conexibacter stalactiti]